jgi:hypothetical protein
MERELKYKFVSIFIVGMFLFTIVPSDALAVDYWYPELFDNDEFVPQGMSIERYTGLDATITVVERDFDRNATLDGIYIEINVVDNIGSSIFRGDGQTNISDNTTTFSYIRFIIDAKYLNKGTYTIQLSAVFPLETKTSTYFMDVIEGGGYEKAFPISVSFLSGVLNAGQPVDCTVKMSSDVTFLTFRTGNFAANLIENEIGLWECSIFFYKVGYNTFTIDIVDDIGLSYVFEYQIYVSEDGVELDIPTVRIQEYNGYFTTILINKVWIETSVYIDTVTWHVNVAYSDNVIIDLSIAEPLPVERSFMYYKYISKEIQIIVGGVSSGIAITYVLDSRSMKVSNIFSSVKIKGVNDWRNMWGLLSGGELLVGKSALTGNMVWNVDYENVYGVYTSQKSLVARY